MFVPPELINDLNKTNSCEVKTDLAARILYSTDASIYQIEPLAVVLPRSQEGLLAAVELASKYHTPMLARGSGTSLAGQAVNQALILDCSRWLDNIVMINPDEQTAVVEPGVILSVLNNNAAKYGLQFGPDPASAERATMAGVISNNATGAHSIRYGMAADHILSADVIFSDGTTGTLAEIPLSKPGTRTLDPKSRVDRLINSVDKIRENYSTVIKKKYPSTWRNSAGYRLNYLLPWSPQPPPRWEGNTYPPAAPGMFNLASQLAGSEGTLAVIQRLTVNLVKKPEYSVLGILTYTTVADACDAVQSILDRNPSAIELIPRVLLRLAKSIPTYESQLVWVQGDPGAILVVEFSGDDLGGLIERSRNLHQDVQVLVKKEDQDRVWNIRKVGLGLLDSKPQSSRPVAFVEDCVVPVPRLGDFVRSVEKILTTFHTEGNIYAHASAGCLHIRPILNLKTRQGRQDLRSIAEEILVLVISLGGAMSSEHGDGILRGEWLNQTYGPEMIAAMRSMKVAADPEGLLNPHKMFDAPSMDTNLRYSEDYSSHPWNSSLDFSRNGGLDTAIEQCNGQGVCRKFDGIMCPSFQATRDEMHSTRGRANLLRALIGNPQRNKLIHPSNKQPLYQSVKDALDLCLGCKGCAAECPSGVDMAKLKNAFTEEYYRTHRRPLRDYLFGYFHVTADLLSKFSFISNRLLGNKLFMDAFSRLTGITNQRPLPMLARNKIRSKALISDDNVIFLADSFTHYFEPEVEQAALEVLQASGVSVTILPISGAGASLISKGFISAAHKHASQLLEQLERIDPKNEQPLICIEPPEVSAIRNDYYDLLDGGSGSLELRLRNVFLIDEFIVRRGVPTDIRVANNHKKILFHPHCHQKAEKLSYDSRPIGEQASLELLKMFGYEVELSEAGCCGMAGTFGYEAEHYGISKQIGELKLLPKIRRTFELRSDAIVASTGSACRLQIRHGSGVIAVHPIQLVRDAILLAS